MRVSGETQNEWERVRERVRVRESWRDEASARVRYCPIQIRNIHLKYVSYPERRIKQIPLMTGDTSFYVH